MLLYIPQLRVAEKGVIGKICLAKSEEYKKVEVAYVILFTVNGY